MKHPASVADLRPVRCVKFCLQFVLWVGKTATNTKLKCCTEPQVLERFNVAAKVSSLVLEGLQFLKYNVTLN